MFTYNRYIITLFFWVVCASANSQTVAIDSLRKVNRTCSTDTCRVQSLMLLGSEFYRINPDSAMFYWEKCRKLGKAVRENVDQGTREDIVLANTLATALNNMGYLKGYLGDSVSSVSMHLEAYQLSKYTGNTEGMGFAMHNLGGLYARKGYHEKAFRYYFKSLALRRKLGEKSQIASTYIDIGAIYEKTGDAIRAFKYYSKALKLDEEIQNYYGMAHIYNNMGVLHVQSGDVKKGLYYYNRAFQIRDSIGDVLGSAYALSNLGAVHNSLKKYEQALQYLNQCLEVSAGFNEPGLKGQVYTNMGIAYENLGDEVKAEENFLRAYEIQSAAGEEKGSIYSRTNLARLYLKQKKVNEARILASGALSTSQKLKNVKGTLESASVLHEIYMHTGQWEDAYLTLLNYNEAKRQIDNEENQRASIEQETRYAYEKKSLSDSLKNELNRQELLRTEENLGKEQQVNLILSGGVIAICLFLILLIFAYRKKNRSEAALKRSKEKIEKQDQEKELLLKEIHHRVKNNLQVIIGLLELQAVEKDDASFSSAMAEGQSRVRSIALIHEKLYQKDELSVIDMLSYAEGLSRELQSTYSNGQKIESQIYANNLKLDIDTAIPLGLIMNELISNSWKYAFTNAENGKLSVRIMKNGNDNYILEYRDSGPGLPQGYHPEKFTSLGMRLVHRLSRQLSGKVEYKGNEQGVYFIITFKDTDQRKQSD